MNSRRDIDSTTLLGRSRTGLLTTYRRNGEPVATPVSIAARDGGVYFVTSAGSGKARRLTARAGVTLAPCTIGGAPTGPAVRGEAHLLNDVGRHRIRRLLQPGGALFWSSTLYRIRGNHMLVYVVIFSEPVADTTR